MKRHPDDDDHRGTPARSAPPAPQATRPYRRPRLAVRRPLRHRLRAGLPRAPRVLALPERLPRSAGRRQRVRRLRQLHRRLRRREVLGRPRPRLALPRHPGAGHAPAGARGGSRDRQRAAPRRRLLPHRDLPPLRRPRRRGGAHVGVHLRRPVRSHAQSERPSRRHVRPALRPRVDAGLDRQHRHVAVRGLQHAHLLLVAEDHPGELYEAASIDGAGAWRTIFSIKIPAVRARSSSRRSSRSSAASSSSTSPTS